MPVPVVGYGAGDAGTGSAVTLGADGVGGASGLRHRALLAPPGDERDDEMATFVGDGLDAGNAVLLAVGDATRARLAERLGSRLDDDAFLGLDAIYTSPAWGLGRLRAEIDRCAASGTRLQVLFEPRWWTRPVEEWEAWVSTDAVTNVAFAGADVEMLCSYDATAPPVVLEAVGHTHPEVVVDGQGRRNPAYTDPALYCTRHRHEPLPALPEPVDEHDFSGTTLGELRRVVAPWAGAGGLHPSRIPEVVLAVHEVATNSVRHGGGSGVLRLAGTRAELLAEVEDAGTITAPFAGLLPPTRIGENGYGLWLVHQLVELVQIRSGPGGSTVRLHVRLKT
jgi:anti-sigma regulatory factor (Ser/Thr protein kinase)